MCVITTVFSCSNTTALTHLFVLLNNVSVIHVIINKMLRITTNYLNTFGSKC